MGCRVEVPSVRVAINAACMARPVEAVLGGEIDLRIVTTDGIDARRVVRPLFADEWVLAVSARHPLAERAFVEPAARGGQHLILWTSSSKTSFTMTRILEPAGVTQASVSHVQLAEAILELVKADVGASLMPLWVIYRTWSIVTLRQTDEAPWLGAFVSLLARQGAPALGTRRSGPRSHRAAPRASIARPRLSTPTPVPLAPTS